jgi:hypothetical protein
MVQNMQISDQSAMTNATKANLNTVMLKSSHPIVHLVSGKRKAPKFGALQQFPALLTAPYRLVYVFANRAAVSNTALRYRSKLMLFC